MKSLPEVDVLPFIFSVRGQKVILDADLARLYGVSPKRLNEQVRRNAGRFPEDFVFRLSAGELERAISLRMWGGRRYPPLAFTEHGAVMAANVLNSERAVAMSVEVVRAFIRLRRAALSQGKIAEKLSELESLVKTKLDQHSRELDSKPERDRLPLRAIRASATLRAC